MRGKQVVHHLEGSKLPYNEPVTGICKFKICIKHMDLISSEISKTDNSYLRLSIAAT